MAKHESRKMRAPRGAQAGQPAAQAAAAPAGPTPDAAPATGGASPSLRRSQAQKRAEHALGQIAATSAGGYGNYASYVKALPARIIMNGLGQALAMERAGSEKDPGHKLLYRHMDAWLRTGWEHSPYKGQPDILKAIVSGSEADYIRAQGEAMAYLEWLKKFAAAFLKEQEGDDAASAS
ncbi:MAG: hypothetical protein KatS3mg118_3015 [Paracoccaceae bacterium]|nr:MAG: hypothetical protein KatS3mg118_3015 [Paracoccaceae bacterium]